MWMMSVKGPDSEQSKQFFAENFDIPETNLCLNFEDSGQFHPIQVMTFFNFNYKCEYESN